MNSRLPLLLLVATACAGCPHTGESEWVLEACDVWTCGEPRPLRPCGDLCERPQCAAVTVFGRDPSDGACVPFASACDVPERWHYFYDDEQCLAGRVMCHDSDQCDEAEVCDIRSCAADAVGTCVARPIECSESGGEAEVLSCDGTVFSNDCERLQSGARLGPEAVVTTDCGETGVWARDPRTGACGYYESACDVPDAWPYFHARQECEGPGCSTEPVWGRDPESGQCVEFANDCVVPLGVEFFASRRACEAVAASCSAAAECPAGQACDVRGCGSERLGSCVPWPEECVSTEGAPPLVCGCDGVTYWNDCERLTAGTGLAHSGPCGAE